MTHRITCHRCKGEGREPSSGRPGGRTCRRCGGAGSRPASEARPPLDPDRRGEGRAPVVQVSLPRELHAWLLGEVERRGCSPGAVIREALEAYIP